MNAEVPIDMLSTATRPGSHVWIGRFAPLDWISLDLDHGTNFRASSIHHQQFDTVWYFEESFHHGNLARLELILDELIRLLKTEGLLILRYEYELVAAVKRFLARRPGGAVEIEREWRRNGELITSFRVRRENLELYRDPNWTFAVLTSGKKEPEVVKFVRSIRERPEGREHEIIICGPRAASYDAYGVVYLDKIYRDDLAEIAKKKNDIAALARHPNLLLCHDRYKLNPDFFEGFERFGYDFDYVTVRQWLDTGEEFPSYCALVRGDLIISSTRMLHRYDALYTGHFVNGGLFAIKTHTFRALPLNPIIFWEQAEDVEFTQMLRDHSLPPRINVFSSAETQLAGPRGLDTRRIYRIGLPPLPDEYTGPPPTPTPVEPVVPPSAATPAEPPPPGSEAPPPEPPPSLLRRCADLTEKLLAPVLGAGRATTIVARFRQRKRLTAAWALLILLHAFTLLLLMMIVLRLYL